FGTKSHIKAILEISDYLSNLGHQVVYATQRDKLAFSQGYNVTQLALPDINYHSDSTSTIDSSTKNINKNLLKSAPFILSRLHSENYINLSNLNKESKFDLFICDFLSSACQDVAYMHGVPLVVGFQTLDIVPELGEGYKTTINGMGPLTLDGLNFFQRYYYKFMLRLKTMWIRKSVEYQITQSRLKHEIKSKAFFGDLKYAIAIANSYFGFEIPAKAPPNFHTIGPLSKVSEHTEINEKEYPGVVNLLNNSNNILYVAFGSSVALDSNIMYKLMYSILYSIETKVIDGVVWGLGITGMEGLPEEIKVGDTVYYIKKMINNEYPNIQLLKWAPQYSILNHKNTKLFLSHGGLESITEATMTATSILCLPILGDQLMNCKKIKEMGIGINFELNRVESNQVIDSIRIILKDEDGKYKLNSKKYQLITSGTQKRIEIASNVIIKHIELAKLCRPFSPFNPNKDTTPCELTHLIHPSMKLSPFVKYNLDIYLANILILCFVLF
ncbi:UDP-Glycosyltransferase/glycogen phosphorylase, partial [Neoconidiobolus thromboides FSU 785]